MSISDTCETCGAAPHVHCDCAEDDPYATIEQLLADRRELVKALNEAVTLADEWATIAIRAGGAGSDGSLERIERLQALAASMGEM